VLTLPLLLLGCTGKPDDTADSGALVNVPVTVAFRGVAGAADFSCEAPATGIGSTSTTWTPLDFRFYVHGFELLDASGAATPLTLTQDGLWQVEDVALLDFEDRGGTCINGTPETNSVVTGEAPAGTWTGLRFRLGVPFALNHGDVATAPSPLNVSTLFWSWQMGYKFARIDGRTTGLDDGAIFHLGSTGCMTDDQGEVTGCDAENVATITLDGFDPGAGTVIADLAGLFQGVDMDTNAGGDSVCMSGGTDPECGQIFANLGLDFGGTAGNPAAQSFFRAE